MHTLAAVLKGGEEEERIDPLMSFTLGLTAVTSGERKNFSFYTGERSGVLTGKTDWAYRFCEMSQYWKGGANSAPFFKKYGLGINKVFFVCEIKGFREKQSFCDMFAREKSLRDFNGDIFPNFFGKLQTRPTQQT